MPCHVQYITSSLWLLVIAKKSTTFCFTSDSETLLGWHMDSLQLSLEFNLAINADG